MGHTHKAIKQWKRGSGFQPLENVCRYAFGHFFQTKDFLYTKMAQDWKGIVGPEMASITRPCRIQVFKNEGTLVIEVDVSGSLKIPSYGATLIERVNQYLGYKGVARIIFRKTHFQSCDVPQWEDTQMLDSTNHSDASEDEKTKQLAQHVFKLENLPFALQSALANLACAMKII
ncbi:Zn-ribbon-containing, possibly RNA-binding protein [Holospora obtusa F1]|uniref:Zn-ribbon-containing, possibly RNA-binding protein n=1 Tax=Holospora obtusa F1 TaxID=1399147 RepID=W6TI55_HOLOB|nr:DUF721 domain-containing protein [Holospora obtusa]ETZ07690.1 Zn-ribbon-containing, possibly RNA-binding protein [Holospora obtusa F1]